MSYVAKTLGPDEHIVYRARFHWLYTLTALAALVGLGIILVGVYIFLSMMIKKWTTEIVVTNDRLVMKTGWVARHTQEVSLEKVEEINLEQSVFGRILGFGKLDVRGTGIGNIAIPTVDDPVGLRRAIQAARGHSFGDAPINGRRVNLRGL